MNMRQAVVCDDYVCVELWSLVILSADISHRVAKTEDGWGIWVAEEDYERAVFELDSFEEENADWPPPKPESPVLIQGTGAPAMLVAAGLSLFYNVTGAWSGMNPWFQNGMVNSRAILADGQWWRLITGLTLHADINHLLGNVSLGALVLYYLGQETGAGAALFLAIITGVSGNLLNVIMHGNGHQSVGFSTAVFGMIGVMAGLRIMDRGRGVKGALLPLGAGAGLLAMLGTGGERTDIGAHLWGMASGLLCGILWRWLASRWQGLIGQWWQEVLALCSITIVSAAWIFAWR